MEAEIVRKVKEQLAQRSTTGKSQKVIGEEVGINQVYVSLIKSGRYDHLLVRKPPDQIPPELASIVSPEQSVHLVATSPAQMAMAQDHLVKWFRLKVASFDGELAELDAAIAEAKQNEWNAKPLQSQKSRALVRRTFYEKCLLATDAGFCLIPNIPVSVFAIRVNRSFPVEGEESLTSTWGDPARQVSPERPDILKAGEGRYESPQQEMRHWVTHESNDKGEANKVERRHADPIAFSELTFPLIAAHSQVMNTTQRAMVMKVFDEIGVSPESSSAKGDPLIIGRIIDKFQYNQPRKAISFLIAWNVDLRTL